MRALVTGAGGFLGRSVSKKLKHEGHKVVEVWGPHADSREASAGEIICLDLSEPGALAGSLKHKPDIVIHLAAAIPSAFTGDDANRAAEINRKMDENVLALCRNFDVGAVYASSTSVYGFGRGDNKSETSPVSPVGPYADAKISSEKLGERLLGEQGLPFTILRINAPYGPGQRMKTVLKLFIERAISGRPLKFHGSGSREQDFTHVEDVADAVVKAGGAGVSGLFNISGGNPITMRQLAELVVHCVPGCRSEFGPSGEEDPQEGTTAVFSIIKARELLGWQPRVSLEDGIRRWVANWKN